VRRVSETDMRMDAKREERVRRHAGWSRADTGHESTLRMSLVAQSTPDYPSWTLIL
jgi:hypothetical protein